MILEERIKITKLGVSVRWIRSGEELCLIGVLRGWVWGGFFGRSLFIPVQRTNGCSYK